MPLYEEILMKMKRLTELIGMLCISVALVTALGLAECGAT